MGNRGIEAQTIEQAIRMYSDICWHMEGEGRPPVIRELMVMMDVASSSTIVHYLDVLRQWGWIDCPKGGVRAIRLTRPTECIVIRSKAQRKAKGRHVA